MVNLHPSIFVGNFLFIALLLSVFPLQPEIKLLYLAYEAWYLSPTHCMDVLTHVMESCNQSLQDATIIFEWTLECFR